MNVFVPQLNDEGAFDDQEKLVFVFMLMPRKFPVQDPFFHLKLHLKPKHVIQAE